MNANKRRHQQAAQDLARVLDLMLEAGEAHADIDYRIEPLDQEGRAQVSVLRQQILPHATREMLLLETRCVGAEPVPVASLTRVAYSEPGSSLSWSSDPVLSIEPLSDPIFARALSSATAQRLAPRKQSFFRSIFQHLKPPTPEPSNKTTTGLPSVGFGLAEQSNYR